MKWSSFAIRFQPMLLVWRLHRDGEDETIAGFTPDIAMGVSVAKNGRVLSEARDVCSKAEKQKTSVTIRACHGLGVGGST